MSGSIITSLPTFSIPPPQATGLLTFFLPDSAPLSLVASIVQVTYITTKSVSGAGTSLVGGDWVTSLVLDCPPTTKPVKDACRAAGIYPASGHHTQGSIWAGTTTLAADDSTTTWRCSLGKNYPSGIDPSNGSTKPVTSGAVCTKTIEGPGKARETITVDYDNCYVLEHQLPIIVTAGGEKIGPGGELSYGGFNADDINSAHASLGQADGCAETSLVFWKVSNGPGFLGSATTTGGPRGGPGPTPTAGGSGSGPGASGPGANGPGSNGPGANGPGAGGSNGDAKPTGAGVPSSAGRAMRATTAGLVKGGVAALAVLAVLAM